MRTHKIGLKQHAVTILIVPTQTKNLPAKISLIYIYRFDVIDADPTKSMRKLPPSVSIGPSTGFLPHPLFHSSIPAHNHQSQTTTKTDKSIDTNQPVNHLLGIRCTHV